MKNAIEVRRLSKRYCLGRAMPGANLRDVVTHRGARLLRRAAPPARDEIWSLRDIDLDVVEGSSLGVIGRNGAGKSTLLKILSRITEPTSGLSRTRGRVASLLEVGTGFHPELTGRENVYLNAALLGMSRRSTTRRFDDIVEFAGVARFIDTPIKRYSSGMYLRLAFAVAAHLEPDILIVDEVLAVGDVEFQARCMGRMATAGREGRTVLFVSHNLDAVTKLCGRAVLLDAGRVSADGGSAEVVDRYLESLASVPHQAPTGSAAGPVSLSSLSVLDETGRPAANLRRDRPFTIEVRFAVRAAVPGLDVSLPITTVRGVQVLCEAWGDRATGRPYGPGTYVARLAVPPLLNVGEYLIGVWIGTRYDTFIEEPAAAHVRLEGDLMGRPDRLVDLRLPWDVDCLPEPDEGAATTASTRLGHHGAR